MTDAGTGRVAVALAALLALYKRFVSPLLPPACRFTPTCSEYAREAILAHGAGRGVILALKRLARCHPFHPGGHDPVPPGHRGGTAAAPEQAGTPR